MLPLLKQSAAAPQAAASPGDHTRSELQDTETGADNLPNVCRACLVMGVRLYDMSEHRLSAMYAQVTGVMINAEDKLPRRLCWECAARLASANNFIVKALRTHWMLSNKLSSGGLLSLSDIISIDRAQHRLESRLSSYLINDAQYSSLAIEHLAENNIKQEDLSDIDIYKNNEEDENTEILEPKEEIHFNWNISKVEINDSENDIDLVKRELADTDVNEQLSANGAECPNTAEIECHSSVENITFKCKSNAEETPSNTATEATRDEAIETKSYSELHDVSASSRHVTDASAIMLDHKSVENLLICNICDKLFHHKSVLKKHILNHPEYVNRQLAQSVYNCSECLYKTHNKYNFDQHVNSQHTKSNSCDGPETYDKNHLTKHTNSQQTKSTTYDCSVCSFKASAKINLIRHMNSQHVKSAFYNCSECLYKTYNKYNYKQHVNSQHTKSISYNCSDCSYKTYNKYCLTKHINSQHTNITSFDCSDCSFKASAKINLIRHMNSQHVKSAFYNCSECLYKTYNKYNYKQHVNSQHTKSISYNCPECSYKTYAKNCLNKHINNQHTKSKV